MLVDRPPVGPQWRHEIKFDGWRMQAQVSDHNVSWFTRNGLDWSAKLRRLSREILGLPDCVLDGELTAVDAEGRSDFSAFRAAQARGEQDRMVYFAFDLLALDGEDLRARPYEVRKALLRDLIEPDGEACSDQVRYVEDFAEANPSRLWKAACALQLEGIVSKRLGSPYVEGRGPTWRKAKCRPSADVVILGWRQEGARFNSLIAGRMVDGVLTYGGRVHTGYPHNVVLDLLRRLRPLEVATTPAAGAPRKTRDVHWVRPELVAEIELAEWTAGGKVRQGSFKRLRPDKDPSEAEG